MRKLERVQRTHALRDLRGHVVVALVVQLLVDLPELEGFTPLEPATLDELLEVACMRLHRVQSCCDDGGHVHFEGRRIKQERTSCVEQCLK